MRFLFVFLAVAIASAQAPFGFVDCPNPNSPNCPNTALAGAINITGWTLSQNTVSRVSIYRAPIPGEPTQPNGLVYVQDAHFIPGSRYDVAAVYPAYPNNNWGWGTLVISNELPDSNADGGRGNGTYTLHAIAYDPFGTSADLGQVMITVTMLAPPNPSAHSTRRRRRAPPRAQHS